MIRLPVMDPRPIPRPALWIGLVGLMPFLYGAGVVLGLWTPPWPELAGRQVLRSYGAISLGFMGGVLWGFACRRDRQPRWRELLLAVAPGLWAFLAHLHPQPLGALAAGFVVVLGIDMMFWIRQWTPPWWMAYRLPLTVAVVACLIAGTSA